MLPRNHPLIHQVILTGRDEVRQTVDAVLDDQAFDLIVTDTGDTGIVRAIRDSGAERVTNLRRSLTPHVLVGEQFLRILMVEELIDPGTITRPRLYPTPDEQDRARAALGEIRHPVVFFFPDAGAEIKRWPPESFIALGKVLRQRYDASIIIPAGDDPARAAGIANEIGGTARVWPRGSLRDLAAMIEGADLMVAADTGVARIAAALKVPTITLFGPSWYAHFGQPAPHLNLQGYSECPERVVRDFTMQRCWINGVCPLGHWSTCLETISPGEVLDAAASFLDHHAPGRHRPPSDPRYSAFPA